MKHPVLVLLLVALASSAAAQPEANLTLNTGAFTLKDYWQTRKVAERNVRLFAGVEAYIQGIADGLSIASAVAALESRAPALCVPKGLTLNAENYKDMIDDQVRERLNAGHPFKDTDPIGIPLFLALVKAFPCTSAPPDKK